MFVCWFEWKGLRIPLFGWCKNRRIAEKSQRPEVGIFSEVANAATPMVRWRLSQPLLGFGVGVGGGVAVGLGGVGDGGAGVEVGAGAGGGG